mmetsp:Transcript_27310/g.81680  ORF Transcript_27310/g.81680 Transcript_27310/m.81680 type:complete len:287 (+) Transcript_27310:872-1732(+)
MIEHVEAAREDFREVRRLVKDVDAVERRDRRAVVPQQTLDARQRDRGEGAHLVVERRRRGRAARAARRPQPREVRQHRGRGPRRVRLLQQRALVRVPARVLRAVLAEALELIDELVEDVEDPRRRELAGRVGLGQDVVEERAVVRPRVKAVAERRLQFGEHVPVHELRVDRQEVLVGLAVVADALVPDGARRGPGRLVAVLIGQVLELDGVQAADVLRHVRPARRIVEVEDEILDLLVHEKILAVRHRGLVGAAALKSLVALSQACAGALRTRKALWLSRQAAHVS